MNEELAHIGFLALNAEQRVVVWLVVVQRLTEAKVADELGWLTGKDYTRNRIHRVVLTSLDRMRRTIEAYLVGEGGLA